MNFSFLLPLVVILGVIYCDITDDLIAESEECKQDFLAMKDHCKFSDHVKVGKSIFTFILFVSHIFNTSLGDPYLNMHTIRACN